MRWQLIVIFFSFFLLYCDVFNLRTKSKSFIFHTFFIALLICIFLIINYAEHLSVGHFAGYKIDIQNRLHFHTLIMNQLKRILENNPTYNSIKKDNVLRNELFFYRNRKIILKFIWDHRKIRITKGSLKKNKQLEASHVLISKCIT